MREFVTSQHSKLDALAYSLKQFSKLYIEVSDSLRTELSVTEVTGFKRQNISYLQKSS
jgi:hypothetical protein